jgi:hypothetical protein
MHVVRGPRTLAQWRRPGKTRCRYLLGVKCIAHPALSGLASSMRCICWLARTFTHAPSIGSVEHPLEERLTARPHRATVDQPDRTGLSRKTGSVILPGEGGLTGAPVPMRWAKPTPTGAGRGCWRGRARSTRLGFCGRASAESVHQPGRVVLMWVIVSSGSVTRRWCRGG